MPTVPRVTSRRGATAPLPQVRPPDAAFGVAQPLDISGPTQLAGRLFEVEREKADQLQILTAKTQLAGLRRTLLEDREKGLLNARGINALDASDRVHEEWERGLSEIRGKLTERQRARFEEIALSATEGFRLEGERHVSQEMRRYDEAATKAALDSHTDSALSHFSDRERVTQEIGEGLETIRESAQRLGLPPEARDLAARSFVSGIHSGVIGQMLVAKQDREASSYYQEVKDLITADERVKIEKALEEGSTRGESQRRADAIVSTHQTRAEAIKAVKEIEDPELRDATHQRVTQHFNEQEVIEREQSEDRYLKAANLSEANPGRLPRDVIPPGMWAQLTPAQRDAIERRASEPGVNDDRAWLTFLSLDPKDIGKLSRSEFEAQYWSRFDNSHRSRAESLWLGARDALADASKPVSPELTSAMTVQQRVDNALRSSGLIDPEKRPNDFNDEEIRYYNAFEAEAERRINHYEQTTLEGKRKANADEVRGVIDELTIERVFESKPWVQESLRSGRGEARVHYDRMPVARRQQIERLIRSVGGQVTADKVERAYLQVLLQDAEGFDAVIREGVGATGAGGRF